jgi:hypothetical protein
MKKIFLMILPLLAMLFVACDDEVSYSDMKDRESRAIRSFIRSEGINVITLKEFIEKDSVTDLANNEYVLIDGVYMQIIRNPNDVPGARKMNDGETLNIMARFFEYNILDGDTINGNTWDTDNPDHMRVKLSHGSYSATFTSGYMNNRYGSYVPTGWITPLPYIYLTRNSAEYAKVNLIVPHSKGTSSATNYVYPCFYQITFIPEKLYDTN